MKILHTLLGYLTVTVMHFSPFAFVSPLPGIHYNGYVDTTQNHIDHSALMNHAIGNLIETCISQSLSGYVNATQNHSDSAAALMKRVPVLIQVVIAIVAAITLSIAWVESDDPKREASRFAQNTISQMISKYPGWNWVICHSPYSVDFDGEEGTDWGYTHHKLDIYWAWSGTFYRYGDGGFINYASGNILGTDNGGATFHFGAIS